jgi:hypothetical protein
MCSQIVHIIVIIYQTLYLKVNLNTILTSQFQTYLLPTFIIQNLLKFCIQLTTNAMEVLMVFYSTHKKNYLLFYAYVKNCVNNKLEFR